MIHEVIMAGFGGQGIMLMGKVLAIAAMLDDKQVTWFPSYGVEMRGGTANCTVVISDRTIGSPIVANPLASIVMNQQSLERFAPRLKTNGFLLINSSLVKCKTIRDDLETLALPVTDMADKIGTVKIANIIALGAFCAKTGIVAWESLERAMKEAFYSKKTNDQIQINLKALMAGREAATVHK